jgi:hypothetical protein
MNRGIKREVARALAPLTNQRDDLLRRSIVHGGMNGREGDTGGRRHESARAREGKWRARAGPRLCIWGPS